LHLPDVVRTQPGADSRPGDQYNRTDNFYDNRYFERIWMIMG